MTSKGCWPVAIYSDLTSSNYEIQTIIANPCLLLVVSYLWKSRYCAAFPLKMKGFGRGTKPVSAGAQPILALHSNTPIRLKETTDGR